MSDDAKCPYVVGRTTLHCSLTPFTLTDAEREAMMRAVGFCECTTSPLPTSDQIATLWRLLERTK
jgi:hypothetical protein